MESEEIEGDVPLFPVPADDPFFSPEGLKFIHMWLMSFNFKGEEKE